MTVKIKHIPDNLSKEKVSKDAAYALSELELKRDKLNNQMHNMIYDQVFPLSDVLQLEIGVYSDGAGNFELQGSRNWILQIVKNYFKFNTKIEASYVGANESAILVHINKDFWIYTHYSNEIERTGVITMYYLDFKGQKTKLIKDAVHGQDLDNALIALRPLTRAKFVKGTNDLTWKELPLKVVMRVPKSK